MSCSTLSASFTHKTNPQFKTIAAHRTIKEMEICLRGKSQKATISRRGSQMFKNITASNPSPLTCISQPSNETMAAAETFITGWVQSEEQL